MKTRTNLHAGESICPAANLWRKQAIAMADTLATCKKIAKNLPDYPVYVYPGGTVVPVAGVNYPGYGAGTTTGYYDGRDYSGLCG
jgi:hypothetical protein